MFDERTYKFEQERVFSQCSDAASESEDEHHAAHHQEEPDWVEAAQVRDGGDVGENTLEEQSEGLDAIGLEVMEATMGLVVVSTVQKTTCCFYTSVCVRIVGSFIGASGLFPLDTARLLQQFPGLGFN